MKDTQKDSSVNLAFIQTVPTTKADVLGGTMKLAFPPSGWGENNCLCGAPGATPAWMRRQSFPLILKSVNSTTSSTAPRSTPNIVVLLWMEGIDLLLSRTLDFHSKQNQICRWHWCLRWPSMVLLLPGKGWFPGAQQELYWIHYKLYKSPPTRAHQISQWLASSM